MPPTLRRRAATLLAAGTGAAVTLFGLNFLLNPQGAAAAFGIQPWPDGEAAGYYVVKAVRDLAAGASVFLLLALRQRRALGWVMLASTAIPLGDALAVVTHGGTLATALTVHVSAAVPVLLGGLLLTTERDERRESPLPGAPPSTPDTGHAGHTARPNLA